MVGLWGERCGPLWWSWGSGVRDRFVGNSVGGAALRSQKISQIRELRKSDKSKDKSDKRAKGLSNKLDNFELVLK